jgi:hypothetical protein
MALRMVLEGDLFRPLVFCDHCGERIDDARDANAEYVRDAGGLRPLTGQVFFTHKVCSDAFERRHGDTGFEALDVFLVYLENNVRLRRGKALVTARRLAQL